VQEVLMYDDMFFYSIGGFALILLITFGLGGFLLYKVMRK